MPLKDNDLIGIEWEEAAYSWITVFFIGFFLGAVGVIVLLILLHPEPIFWDCGCGAQSAMARQCFESGNLSSWQCGVFR